MAVLGCRQAQPHGQGWATPHMAPSSPQLCCLLAALSQDVAGHEALLEAMGT